MLTTSTDLIRSLQGEARPDAWPEFVRLYTPALYAWARRLGLQDADAIDLVQDVFTVLVQKLPEFRYDRTLRFRGWLWTIARNKWRERTRRKRLPVDGAREPDDVADPVPTSLEEIDLGRHLMAQVLPAIEGQFQPSTWRAFWEHVVAGRTAPDVAAELGVSETAVYKSKIRVLARLHKELGDLVSDDHPRADAP
ncbi:RNA polymerase sigma factor [Frigoriglobus tundricola]|uniref:Transcriptional control n=1 Tax=Frigoriglobus tundricola TaxID=2774151 RepID=A0A6M5Z1R7_9BACT|nr:sigma-70 family RNA polymerase sigma factor [Frigoriglobus tundricola]QJW99570.1 transcriptional control [Frigoriglobus tundricola]